MIDKKDGMSNLDDGKWGQLSMEITSEGRHWGYKSRGCSYVNLSVIWLSFYSTLYSQVGITMTGSSLIRHMTTNTKSAAVSSLAPNPEVVFVLLATIPSTISEIPAVRYNKPNGTECKGKNSSAKLTRILKHVMMFAIP